jgi:microcystin-dependent protein
MSTLSVTKTYLNGTVLTQGQLDSSFDSISAFINGANIDGTNIAVGGVSATQLASNSVTTAKILDTNITLAKLAAEVSAFLLPTGTVLSFAGASTPSGFLLCDGSAISRTTYASLFTAIGVAHGNGDGSTTFHLPDYRGRFLRGRDAGTSRDPDAGSRTASNSGGNSGDAVGSVQSAQTSSHTHTITDPGHLHAVGFNTAGGATIDSQAATGTAGGTYNTNGASTGITGTNATGGNETRPINANVNYIIKI